MEFLRAHRCGAHVRAG